MFIRKYWIPLLVFSIAIVGVGLYLLAIQPPLEPIVIIKPAEPMAESTAEKSTAEKSEVETETPSDTSQGGHSHADGTWHAGPHEVPVETPSTAQGSELKRPRDAAGWVPLPVDIYDQNAWADYYAKAIPEIPTNPDDEAAWQDYFHRVTITKKPVDPTNIEAYRTYIDPLNTEARRVSAEWEKFMRQLSALPMEALPPTVNERFRFFRDVERPYTLAIARLNKEHMRRANEWHRRVDAYLENTQR